MEYEHTSAEELKEVAEREAAEMAEREENWDHEREQLKVSINILSISPSYINVALQDEISALRERITSKAGMDEMNEAFRAEINSLTEENAHLKQLGRERDRELSDQRDKNEELSTRIENLEKERNLLVVNVRLCVMYAGKIDRL